MAEDEEGRQWLVEPPPGAGEISLYVAGGDGADLTPEQEAALGALLESLEHGDAEVIGHEYECTTYSTCYGLKCGKVSCTDLFCIKLTRGVSGPGAWNIMGSFRPPA